jgi:mannosyl-3-phosphoglycerate phosphatase
MHSLLIVSLVIFTDLDGTLLDGAYSFLPALPALEALRRASVPWVICSSKTRREIEYYRESLRNGEPFICENGGAVFVPDGYFGFPLAGGGRPALKEAGATAVREGCYEVLRLGATYRELRLALTAFRASGYRVTGFGDLTAEEIAARTGLPINQAVMAKEREFDEPFYLETDDRAEIEIAEAARQRGLRVSGRGLRHLTGNSDKGRAATILAGLFKEILCRVTFAAIGDGPTDLPMLRAVDRPIIVQRPGGAYDPDLAGEGFVEAGGVGPEGWKRAVMMLLEEDAGRQE